MELGPAVTSPQGGRSCTLRLEGGAPILEQAGSDEKPASVLFEPRPFAPADSTTRLTFTLAVSEEEAAKWRAFDEQVVQLVAANSATYLKRELSPEAAKALYRPCWHRKMVTPRTSE
jgi:hypothetical protein